MRTRSHVLPEPFETLVKRIGTLTAFCAHWEISTSTLQRWTKTMERGEELPRGAQHVISRMWKVVKQGKRRIDACENPHCWGKK
jgi:hypothetical protein